MSSSDDYLDLPLHKKNLRVIALSSSESSDSSDVEGFIEKIKDFLDSEEVLEKRWQRVLKYITKEQIACCCGLMSGILGSIITSLILFFALGKV